MIVVTISQCCWGDSVQFSRSVVSNSLRPQGLQHARLPCPSPTPRAYSDSCPSCQWCHPIISSSVVPSSSHLRSFPASGSFQMNQFFTLGGQSIAISASVLPMNIHLFHWFPLGWTGWISVQSKGLSRVFSNTTVQEHQFFGAELLQSCPTLCDPMDRSPLASSVHRILQAVMWYIAMIYEGQR